MLVADRLVMRSNWFLACFLSLVLVNCSPFQIEEGYLTYRQGKNSLSSEGVTAPVYALGEFLDNEVEAVSRWLKYYQGKGKNNIRYSLERSTKYLPMIKSIFAEHEIPEDLAYMALVESGFTSKAVSHANAVGYWQFIEKTGRNYGLKINNLVDERFDIFDSTKAAAQYLRDLYSIFESWPLALASYNYGEGRVSKAVLNHRTRSFRELSSKGSLPKETRNYVPKIIAVIKIAKDPKAYGFHGLKYQKPLQYDRVTFKEDVDLQEVASTFNVNLNTIKKLNPKYKTNKAPLNDMNEVKIRIPKGII